MSAMARLGLQSEKLVRYIEQDYIEKARAFVRNQAPTVISPASYMQLYNMVIEQCDIGDNSAELYDYAVQVSERFIETDIRPIVETVPSWASDFDKVTAFAEAWTKYTLFVKLIERLFEYMNRYCTQRLGKVHTTEMSYFAFKSQIFWNYKQKLVQGVVP